MSIESSANEATTRSQLIDTQLAQAGWSKSRRSLVEEFVVMVKEPDRSLDGQQFADYVLLGSDGKPLAVVEAKRTARDELAGKRQAADAIKSQFDHDPFIFLTNGKEKWRRKSEQRDKWKLRASSRAEEGLARRSF